MWSDHEGKVGVADAITDVDESTMVCIATVVCHESWPEMRFQSGNCWCLVNLNAPSILWLIRWNWVQKISCISCFPSLNFTFNLCVLWSSQKLPVFQFEGVFFWKPAETFVHNSLTCWSQLQSILWETVKLSDLSNYVAQTFKFCNWFWMDVNS